MVKVTKKNVKYLLLILGKNKPSLPIKTVWLSITFWNVWKVIWACFALNLSKNYLPLIMKRNKGEATFPEFGSLGFEYLCSHVNQFVFNWMLSQMSPEHVWFLSQLVPGAPIGLSTHSFPVWLVMFLLSF